MITSLFLTIFLVFFNYILSLLPTGTLNSSITSGITAFFAYIFQFNAFFPIDTAIILVQYAVIFWLAIFTFDFFKWLIHLIRGN